MPNAFGFEQYPQKPAPDRRMIGQSLAQMGQAGQQMGQPGMEQQPGMEPPEPPDMVDQLAMTEGPNDEGSPSALAVAEDEASLSAGDVGVPQYLMGPTAQTIRQLRRGGVSDMEIKLLVRSGRVR